MPNSLPPTNYYFPRKDSFIIQKRSRETENVKRNENSIYHATPKVTDIFHGKRNYRKFPVL
jgi:hypothetical protein